MGIEETEWERGRVGEGEKTLLQPDLLPITDISKLQTANCKLIP
jgi:hypothetical protein